MLYLYPSRTFVVFLRLTYHRLLLSPCVWVSFSPLFKPGRIGRPLSIPFSVSICIIVRVVSVGRIVNRWRLKE
jgi:hypothetical protein